MTPQTIVQIDEQQAIRRLSKKTADELMGVFHKILPMPEFNPIWLPGGRYWFTTGCTEGGLPESATWQDFFDRLFGGKDVTLLDLPPFGHPSHDVWMKRLYDAAPDIIRTAINREYEATIGYRWTLTAQNDAKDDPATVYYHRVFQQGNLMGEIARARMSARIYSTGGILRLLRVDHRHPVHGLKALDPRYCISTGDEEVPIIHFRVVMDGREEKIEAELLYWWEVIRIVDGNLPDSDIHLAGRNLGRPALLDVYNAVVNGAAIERLLGAQAGNGKLARLIFLFGLEQKSFEESIEKARKESGRFGTELPGAVQVYPIDAIHTDDGEMLKPEIIEYLLQKWPDGIPSYTELSRHTATVVQARLKAPLNIIYNAGFGDSSLSQSRERIREAQETGDTLVMNVVRAINLVGIEAPAGAAPPTLRLDEVASSLDEVRSLQDKRSAEAAEIIMRTEVARRQALAGAGQSIEMADEEARAIYGVAYRPGMLLEYQQVDPDPQPFSLSSDDRPRLGVDISVFVDGVVKTRSEQVARRRRASVLDDVQRFRAIRRLNTALSLLRLQSGEDDSDTSTEIPPDGPEAELLALYMEVLQSTFNAFLGGTLVATTAAPTLSEVLAYLKEQRGNLPESYTEEKLDQALDILGQAATQLSPEQLASLLTYVTVQQQNASAYFWRAVVLDATGEEGEDDLPSEAQVDMVEEEERRNQVFLWGGALPRFAIYLMLGDSTGFDAERRNLIYAGGALWYVINAARFVDAPPEAVFEFTGPDDARNCITCAEHVGKLATAAAIREGRFPRPARDTICGQNCRHLLEEVGTTDDFTPGEYVE